MRYEMRWDGWYEMRWDGRHFCGCRYLRRGVNKEVVEIWDEINGRIDGRVGWLIVV